LIWQDFMFCPALPNQDWLGETGQKSQSHASRSGLSPLPLLWECCWMGEKGRKSDKSASYLPGPIIIMILGGWLLLLTVIDGPMANNNIDKKPESIDSGGASREIGVLRRKMRWAEW
jgi:hypothetical protein